MLRYIFLKLSGFTSKKEFSISSSCNQMLMFRPSTSTKKEFRRGGRSIDQSRPQHKRSYSFPSRSTKRNHFLDKESLCEGWTKSKLSKCPSLQPIRSKSSFRQNSSKVSKASNQRTSSVNSEKYSTKKTQQEKVDMKANYHEMSCLDNSERYELEVARPRRGKSELVLNVFDYVAKDVDLTDYLQPSNLRPFGSNDNIYLPLLMCHKNGVCQSNPNYLQNVADVDTPQENTVKTVEVVKKSADIKSNPINKLRDEFKSSGPYRASSNRYTEDISDYVEQQSVDKSVKSNPPTLRDTVSKSLNNNELTTSQSETTSQKPTWSKSSITIEPPPFLTKREDNMFASSSFGDMNIRSKRNITNYMQVQSPWPSYSDHVKSMPKKTLVTYPTGTVMENVDDVADTQQKPQRKVSLSLPRSFSMTNVKTADDKPKAVKKQETIRSNVPQRRTLSMEHVRSNTDQSQYAENVPKGTKSSVYTSKSLTKNSMTQNLVSLYTKGVSINPSHSYAKSYGQIRQLEPKPCKAPDKKKKCFLPSKVRLKPPKCIIPKYEDCVKPEPCPPRADDSVPLPCKKLPMLKVGDCKCVEPQIPDENPKLKRLDLKFVDEPRCCPCVPAVDCPCPPPPRADDFTKPKEKKLVRYVPGECACIEPPGMINVPLVRLQKICVPEEKCYPKKPCVVETCEDKERADDCLKECTKELPLLKMGNCQCMEQYIPDLNPKMKRLKIEAPDPPRVCPCEEPNPCDCPEAPVRADQCVEEKKVKKLQIMTPKECACVEPPPMVDVKLKRLVKKCIPEDVCHPVRECPVEIKCEDKCRADTHLVVKPKKLRKITSDCECFEPHVPYHFPKLRRLDMKFVDEPRICPCVPTECPCPPPPPRADECTPPPKIKKLVPLAAKDCACIEPPRMIDVPLVRLQKVCIPEEKCYPKKPCIVETCEDKERADDCMQEKPKKLRPIEPKPCPCIDYRMTKSPKMKRLSLSLPDPPRICPPVKECPPPDVCCARADDCAPEKIKKLRTIVPGDCPCIEQPMVDVKPLVRLKCKDEPEECLQEDPCLDFPRADWGCWEYLQDVEGTEKHGKCEKNKDLNYKQKRKFNTDSRINSNSRRNKSVSPIIKKDQSIEVIKEERKTKDLKVNTKGATISNIGNKSGTKKNKLFQDTKSSTLPRDIKPKTLKTLTLAKPKTEDKKHVGKRESINRNKSLPTLFLLKELDQIEDTTKTKSKDNNNNKLSSILTKITNPPNQISNCNVRNLSTVVIKAKKGGGFSPGTAQASSKSSKDNKDCEDPNKAGKKTCPNLSKNPKCPHRPMILRNCPAKEQRTCEKERPLVCCEKKPLPNPAFSECMEGEIQPFSDSSQWTCNRRPYGFEPNPKKPYEPLDTVKNKKFSTSAANNRNEDNSVVNYYSARYTKTDADQSRKNSGNVFERTLKTSCSYRETPHRDSSTLTDAMSDVTGCRVVKKDFVSAEDRYPKLLNKKLNYTVAGVSCRKMSTQNRGPYNSQPSINRSFLQDMPMLSNRYITGDLKNNFLSCFSFTSPPHRPYSDERCKTGRPECKFPKKKKGCPKFELSNCPEKARQTCKVIPDRPICRERPPAPYPSFSELMNDEMEDKLTECPMGRDKVEELQPAHGAIVDKKELLPPIEPAQGKIDHKIEEKCVREKLCMANEGLTQDCKNFGSYIKPLKSKHFFRDKNRDCERIEELKKIGKWPPKRKFSTCASTISVNQKRNLCSSVNSRISDCVPSKLKNTSIRNFHALCKKPLNHATGEGDKETYQNHAIEIGESCRGFRNIQWRIDNYQKWYRLKKMSNHPHLTKRYHTCSKLKYRRFVRSKKTSKPFTTYIAKTRVANLTVRGVICSKLKYKKFEKNRHSPKHLSISSNKTPIVNLEDSKKRGISTTNILAKKNKQKLIKFPLYPRPLKKNSTLKTAMNKVEIRGEKNKFKQENGSEGNVRWQPKYPTLPEVDTVSIPPYQPKMESSWEKECLIHFSGKKKKGKSWDCSAVEKPFIDLNSSNLVEDCTKQDKLPCIPCGEVFMRNNHVQDKPTKQPNKADKCKKFSNPCPIPNNQVKKSRSSYRLCPPESAPPPLSLWGKIVNYFKAKPNCPAPDEWKKKALREKAEKAAKAAGLCLCEPAAPPPIIPDKICEREGTNGSKGSNDCGLPSRKGSFRTTTRHYSSSVNIGNNEELDKPMEEEKKKRLAKKLSQVLKEDDDISQKCPDPLLESVFKEAIMNRNSLSCLEEPTDLEPKDECLTYSLNIVPSDMYFSRDYSKELPEEETKFQSNVSDIEECFSKIDSLSDITFEELEKTKTENLVKELDKILKENQKQRKKS